MGAQLVTPFTVSQNNNESLLSLLKNRPPVGGTLPPICQVPVSSDMDQEAISAIISANDRMAETEIRTDAAKQETEGSGVSQAEEEPDANSTPATFVSLSAFAPQNRLHQVTTVFYHNFPSLKMKYIDQVFSSILKAFPGASRSFCFSMVSESFNDTRGVFVRFSSTTTASWFHKNSAKLFPDIGAVFDPSLADDETSLTVTDDTLASLVSTITRIFNTKSYYSQGSSSSGTEDLDEVMQYYKTYKVENSELVEVPKELKETIVMDIIKFRSKVLAIEQEARKKELERERRRAKARLTSIFEGIRSASAPEIEQSEQTMEVAEDAEVADATSAMTDEEYEKHLAEKTKKEQEDKYKQRAQSLQALEQREKGALLKTLRSAQTYEDHLMENKDSFMEDLKMFYEFDPSASLASQFSTPPSALSSTVHARLKLYYSDHQEYLRIRNAERTREEALDKEDALHDVSESTDSSKKRPLITVPSNNKKQKAEIAAEEQAPKASEDKASSVVVANFSESQLESIKTKISDLVEEFLGIKEMVLIDFIYDFVLESNLSSRDSLISELQETLDEDSETVVEQLFAFINGLADST